MRLAPAFLLTGAVLSACRSAGPAPPRPPVAAETPPPGPHRLPGAIRWVRGSAEHAAAFIQAYRWATRWVDAEAQGRKPGGWAVVLDADETLLDNSTYQSERAARGLGFTPDSWDAWVRRREAVPLPGADAFLRHVHALGGRLAIVTNRTESQCPDTEAVFRRHDLPFDVMLCRPDAGPDDKNPRFEAVRRGAAAPGLPPLDVLLFVGDNIRDFPGLDQDARQRPDRDLSHFGERYLIVPNPMYGSWERNPAE